MLRPTMVASLLFLACSPPSPPVASSSSLATAKDVPASGADSRPVAEDLLQERLQKAVSALDDLEARRGPETFGVVGLLDAQPKSKASSAPSPPSVAAPADPLPPPQGPWPVIDMEGGAIKVNGDVVAHDKDIGEGGRVARIDELFTVMKNLREEWRKQHAGLRFPGVAGIRVEPSVALTVFRSAFETTAFAGFPNLYVQSTADPKTILELLAQVPGLPTTTSVAPAETVAAPAEPEPRLFLDGDGTNVTLRWKIGAQILSEETSPLGALGPKICGTWKANGVHRDPSDVRADGLVIHSAAAGTFADLFALQAASMMCVRSRMTKNGEVVDGPVFVSTLSVR